MSGRGLRSSKGDRSSTTSEGAEGSQRTLFISCSALIRETKLCVGPELQEALDTLLATLAARENLAELAVRQLMELVGSIIVQQAGMSVMNARTGVLPRGWLEYVDEASGCPYYYNVHERETTWYRPTPPEKPMAVEHSDGEQLNTMGETHTIAPAWHRSVSSNTSFFTRRSLPRGLTQWGTFCNCDAVTPTMPPRPPTVYETLTRCTPSRHPRLGLRRLKVT